jgi:hypothetical protein
MGRARLAIKDLSKWNNLTTVERRLTGKNFVHPKFQYPRVISNYKLQYVPQQALNRLYNGPDC